MATERIKSIGSGKDYATPALWIAGEVAAIDIGNFKRYDAVDVLPDNALELPQYRLPLYYLFNLPGEPADYAHLKDPLIIPENSADAFTSEREYFYNFDEHISDARRETMKTDINNLGALVRGE
jgi:hypothetical protein